MTSVPPMTVKLRGEAMSCVVDVQLTLSQLGLLFATRLAREMDVWLVRSLWAILDNTRYYLAKPDLLLPAGAPQGGRKQARGLVDVLRQWQSARLETHLAGLHLYWAGSARFDSLLPPDVDDELLERFELLSQELEQLWDDPACEPLGYNPLQECCRDAVALAAALIRYRPIVFTRCAAGADPAAGEPRICAYLRECGIDVQPLDPACRMRPFEQYLRPLFARNGIFELQWAGLDLAALHLVAPGAFVVAASEQESDPPSYPHVIQARNSVRDTPHWRGARAFWYPLN